MPYDVRARDVRTWIAAYDAQGRHRTGSRVDAASGRWLRDAAATLGARAELSALPVDRIVPRSASLTVSARHPGVPLFDSTLPSRPVTGRLGPLGSDADIGVLVVPPAGPCGALDDARQRGSHAAIVALTSGPIRGLALRNAPARAPFGPPVLQVGSEHSAAVLAAAERGKRATVTIEADVRPGTAHNVTARCGTGAAAAVIVLTPRSGWWHCASERGGGIACWLSAVASRAQRAGGRPVDFVATTGHELGSLGLRAHLDRRDADDAVWVHLGANIGARDGLVRVSASDSALATIARRELDRCGRPDVAITDTPVGEARDLRQRGRRFVSLVGSGPHFHMASDRYPGTVDVAAVETYVRAVIGMVDALAA